MRRKKGRIAILTLGLPMILGACSSSECYENHSALPLAGFHSYPYGENISLNGLTIYGIGAPGDSLLYSRETLSQAYLPFRLDSDTTTYVLAYTGAVAEGVEVPTDTITFVYERKPWFVSPACGAMYFYEIKDIHHTRVLIDSIAAEPEITNINSENIKIFFETGE